MKKVKYQPRRMGRVSLHRSPVNAEKGPQRLSSRSIAQMPEDGFAEYRRYSKGVDSFHIT